MFRPTTELRSAPLPTTVVLAALLALALGACRQAEAPTEAPPPAPEEAAPAADGNEEGASDEDAAESESDESAEQAAAGDCGFPTLEQDRVMQWLDDGCYLDWAHDPEIRSSGPLIEDPNKGGYIDNTTHHRVRIYYSPEVEAWLRAGRPDSGIPDGAGIVKEMYNSDDSVENADELIGFSTMLKDGSRSHDGWFWSIYFHEPGHMVPMGEFGYSFCLTCHGSADNPELTFSALEHLDGSVVEPVERLPYSDMPTVTQSHAMGWIDEEDVIELGMPLDAPSEAFQATFPPFENMASEERMSFPGSDDTHVAVGAGEPDAFLTSSNCAGCHDATSIMSTESPHMLVSDDEGGPPHNLSPYGEWRASLMGLAGRDPVFHAQLASEKDMRPDQTAYFDDTCYRCHGVMGQRQVHLDKDEPFLHEYVYATPGDENHKYGALARDGISCTVCHHIADEGLGTEATYTGLFEIGPSDVLYGPYDDPKTHPMQNAIGITPAKGDQLQKSALCGSCHTVILPVLPPEGETAHGEPVDMSTVPTGHEQATYLEWRNSIYQNEQAPIDEASAQTCQGCHMPRDLDGEELAFQIANIEDETYPPAMNRAPDEDITLEERSPFGRHTLVGANLFVMEMFQQFPDLLGVNLQDPLAPGDAASSFQLAAEESLSLVRDETATVAITSLGQGETDLEATVEVVNLAGHKLPSGVGFRRAFLAFEILDEAGEVLWASGGTDGTGVILGADGAPLVTEFSPERTEIQPHHELITSPEQVQIYEERHLDENGQLTTSFVGLADAIKDNRLLPRGWRNDAPDTDFLQPVAVDDDPRYADGSGSDEVRYAVPLAEIPGAASVRAALYYQSIPPYYLAERFDTSPNVETDRLYYIASQLDLEGGPLEDWKLEVASAERAIGE